MHEAILKNRKFIKHSFDSKNVVPKVRIFKRPDCYINNENFKVSENNIEFLVMLNEVSKRISASTEMSNKQKEIKRGRND